MRLMRCALRLAWTQPLENKRLNLAQRRNATFRSFPICNIALRRCACNQLVSVYRLMLLRANNFLRGVISQVLIL